MATLSDRVKELQKEVTKPKKKKVPAKPDTKDIHILYDVDVSFDRPLRLLLILLWADALVGLLVLGRFFFFGF